MFDYCLIYIWLQYICLIDVELYIWSYKWMFYIKDVWIYGDNIVLSGDDNMLISSMRFECEFDLWLNYIWLFSIIELRYSFMVFLLSCINTMYVCYTYYWHLYIVSWFIPDALIIVLIMDEYILNSLV